MKFRDFINEETKKGWKGTVRAMLTHHPDKFSKNADSEDKGGKMNPWAIAHAMAKKGAEPHYKDQESSLEGKPKKKKKFEDEEKNEQTQPQMQQPQMQQPQMQQPQMQQPQMQQPQMQQSRPQGLFNTVEEFLRFIQPAATGSKDPKQIFAQLQQKIGAR